MVVGEAPWREEKRLKRPFVGPAGMCLRGAFTLVGLDVEELWLTNVVKVQPRGRNPNRTEINQGLGYLGKEIRYVAPTCILALGGTAYETLTGGRLSMGEARKIEHALDPQFGHGDAVVLATWHPIHVMRFGAADVPQWKDDLDAFRQRI